MTKTLAVLLWTALLCGSMFAGPLDYQVVQNGATGSYTYFWTGGSFADNTELDIRFDPLVFESISNPSSHAGFNVRLFQPDSPPGAVGILSLLSEIDNSLLDTPVTVQFALVAGQTAGAQPFFVNEYDAETGEFLQVLQSGTTTPVAAGAVPEPGTFVLCGVALLLVSAAALKRR